MGMEDDFLQNDVDDEKTIEYIKNYLPLIFFTSFRMLSLLRQTTNLP